MESWAGVVAIQEDGGVERNKVRWCCCLWFEERKKMLVNVNVQV